MLVPLAQRLDVDGSHHIHALIEKSLHKVAADESARPAYHDSFVLEVHGSLTPLHKIHKEYPSARVLIRRRAMAARVSPTHEEMTMLFGESQGKRTKACLPRLLRCGENARGLRRAGTRIRLYF